ncbi:MAG: thioredoxin [Kofleriaceae bacterium]|nr:thioredoxin [Kofleriaceae bacterium]
MSEILPIHVTSKTFEAEVLQSELPVIIDFWAPWCGPCRMIGPVLGELAPKYEGRVKIAKVTVDEEPELAMSFKVRGIPALYAVKDGDVVDKIVGWGGKARLEETLEKLAEMGEES